MSEQATISVKDLRTAESAGGISNAFQEYRLVQMDHSRDNSYLYDPDSRQTPEPMEVSCTKMRPLERLREQIVPTSMMQCELPYDPHARIGKS